MSRGVLVAASLAGLLFYGLNRAGGRRNDALDVMITGVLDIVGMGPNAAMRISPLGLDKIAQREGFSARKYRDADGYSIGYGHFIQVGETFSEPMTREAGRALLLSDVAIAERAVRSYVTVRLTQNQFDALVSLVFNIGAGAFRRSTLLKRLNAGDYAGAASAFDMWNRSGGQVLPVLEARRNDEQQQFLA